ncbi:hypothetical protein BD410DRAFT_784499 [Rickenella mellea]|uniref:Molybdopterin synthase sulfur carrier subunit n=1 Tax=Rickenella mellea TaxID=50990 RepID=A0A4Y7QDU6_9AGAM|nr:hypothetical protein BD410DRAFT_784499 [Rickenella mellea]
MSDTSGPSITVLYFAAALTATGIHSQTVALPSSVFELSSLGNLLVSLHPNTDLEAILKNSQWSVDAEMVEDQNNVVLKGGEEVAVICPVSGG